MDTNSLKPLLPIAILIGIALFSSDDEPKPKRRKRRKKKDSSNDSELVTTSSPIEAPLEEGRTEEAIPITDNSESIIPEPSLDLEPEVVTEILESVPEVSEVVEIQPSESNEIT